MSNREEPTFIVFCPTGRTPPTVQHKDAHLARAEAERLAKINPGSRFYVMQAIGYAEKPTENIWHQIEEIPF